MGQIFLISIQGVKKTPDTGSGSASMYIYHNTVTYRYLFKEN